MSMFRVCVDKDESIVLHGSNDLLSVRQHICISYSGPLSAGGRQDEMGMLSFIVSENHKYK